MPGRWALKYPKHLIALDVLLATYPDACIVWTHRDPAVVLPSVASFTGYIRALTTGTIDEPTYGREWTAFEELVLLRGLAVRDRVGNDDDRFHDLHYRDLMADPAGAVAGICAQFDIPFGDQTAARPSTSGSRTTRARNTASTSTPPHSSASTPTGSDDGSRRTSSASVSNRMRRHDRGREDPGDRGVGDRRRPLALHLAADNEVWGVARFADPAHRVEPERAGITTRRSIPVRGP